MTVQQQEFISDEKKLAHERLMGVFRAAIRVFEYHYERNKQCPCVLCAAFRDLYPEVIKNAGVEK